MVRFVFSPPNAPAPDVLPRRAYLVGKDLVPLATPVQRAGGELLAEPPTRDAVALVVEYDAGSAGILTLQTCLLPTADRTYLLPLELARHRLMLLLRKLEEWGLSTLPHDGEVMTKFDASRTRFTDALVAPRLNAQLSYAPQAFEAAQDSLRLAIEAGEALATVDAGRQRQRPAGMAIAPLRVGCTVSPGAFAQPAHRALLGNFEFLACPIRWADIEREEGKYTYAPTDQWIEWAVRVAKLPIIGGPVIELSPTAMPHWLGVWEHDYEQLRDFAYAHIKRVVTRYRRTIHQWIATSCLCENVGVTLNIDQMVDLTRLAVLSIRKLHPKARVMMEVAYPFGDRMNHEKPGLPPRLFAELIIESGIKIDAVAIRLVMGDDAEGHGIRDLLSIAELLDDFSLLERPLHVSALGMPSASASSGPHWRDGHSPHQQAAWIEQVMNIIAVRHQVRSVSWQGVADGDVPGTLATGGLIDADGKPKPALKAMTDFRRSLDQHRHTSAAPAAG